MVPKLHPKGTSFKGAAQYLLHDKDRADTDERVEWTETRNLAIDNPDTAWRIMAATALDQERLKAQAGVKNTGRKSAKHALHMSLSWHPDQTPTRDDMLEAVDGALRALGASCHQALIVAHNDEEHSHVHILLNRVSPEDGRHLSSSKEKLNLSKWAQEYEERTGIFCENRIINNELRSGGDYVRGRKDQARHLYEQQAGKVANDNANLKDIVAAQKAKDHALALRGRNQAKLHAGAKTKLDDIHRERKAALARNHTKSFEKARIAIIEKMRPAHIALKRQQAKELATFEAMEKSFFGRAGNIVKTMRVSADDVRQQKSDVIKRTFGILTNASSRKAYFDGAQQRARASLQKEQRDRTDAAKTELKVELAAKQARARNAYSDGQVDLRAKHGIENAALKSDWAKRTVERREALSGATRIARVKDQARSEFRKASEDPLLRTADAIERSRARMEAFDRARAARSPEQDNKRNRDDDRDR